MNVIREFFVSAKHWQLSLICLGPFAVAPLIPDWVWSSQSLLYWIPMTALSIVFACYIFLWAWSYGSFLCAATPHSIRLKLRFFRVAVIFLFIYLPVPNLVPLSKWDWLLPLDFLCMLCALYAALFVARSLVRAETGKRGTFTDNVVAFLLLWLWPIGIWFFQPRINRLFVANCKNGGGTVSGACETVQS